MTDSSFHIKAWEDIHSANRGDMLLLLLQGVGSGTEVVTEHGSVKKQRDQFQGIVVYVSASV